MILVDTSVWIDFFAGRVTAEVVMLNRILSEGRLLVGDLILVELLQGPKHQRDVELLASALAGFDVESLCGPRIAPIAAANYRLLRQRGITVRGTVDVIIATWCIESGIPLLHSDRDFVAMERELGLISGLS